MTGIGGVHSVNRGPSSAKQYVLYQAEGLALAQARAAGRDYDGS